MDVKSVCGKGSIGCKSSKLEPYSQIFLDLRYFKFWNLQVRPTIEKEFARVRRAKKAGKNHDTE